MTRVQRVTFFGGKGGVGKTTCAAAAATLAASEGANVLVVSTDPAHSLGDALGTKLGAAPARIVLHGSRSGELWAAQLDADRALHRWMREHEDAFKTIAERGTYLDDEDVERLFALSLPGVDELVGLLELARLARSARSGDYDHVVVDTAPTGHTLRLLEIPELVTAHLPRFSVRSVAGGLLVQDHDLPTVDVRGATGLTLTVDYADRGDELDYADWLDARLVRNPPSSCLRTWSAPCIRRFSSFRS